MDITNIYNNASQNWDPKSNAFGPRSSAIPYEQNRIKWGMFDCHEMVNMEEVQKTCLEILRIMSGESLILVSRFRLRLVGDMSCGQFFWVAGGHGWETEIQQMELSNPWGYPPVN
jgi:hypothetical protein